MLPLSVEDAGHERDDLLYRTACVLAVLFALIISLTGNNFKPETFIGVVVIWLIARACRYVFAGR